MVNNSRKNAPSLAHRLTLALTVVVACVTMFVGGLFYFFAVNQMEEMLVKRIQQITQHLQTTLSRPLWNMDEKGISAIGKTLMEDHVVSGVIIRDFNEIPVFSKGPTNRSPFQTHAFSVTYEGEKVGTVEIGFSSKPIRDRKAHLLLAIGTTVLAVLLTIALGTLLFLRLFLRHPFAQLTSLAKSFNDTSESNPTISQNAYKEFQPVVSTLNDMKRQIILQIRKLAENEEKFRTIFGGVNDAIFLCEASTGLVLDANPMAYNMLGFSYEEIIGMRVGDFSSGSSHFTQEDALVWFSQAKEEKLPISEWQFKRRDGQLFWAECALCQIRIDDEERILVAARDITERKRYEHELEHKATHDELTDLPNRSLLTDRINQSIFYAMRSKRIVAILLLDLDRFKRINDTLGHSAGDKLLLEVGHRLSNSIRECDTVARFGGDEFVIVLAEIAEFEDIDIVIKNILKALSRPIKINHHELEIGASIGISCFPEDGQNAESLIQKADLAMYQAKQAGGNIFRYFVPEMTVRAKDTLNLEAGIREGLKKKAFVLHYQPKIDVRSGHIVGCEALVRWQHPEKGLLSPGHFISVAEETGLILPLGQWILEESCNQAKNWKNGGLPCKISVNVSARQFQQEHFIREISDVLEKTGVDPSLISLEITESMVMYDIPGAVKTMEQIKELGLGVQLDDFGTGFSNFNSLRKFKVDCLKIDRSFVCDAIHEPSAAAVIQSIIAIAHNLGMVAVAEGVETQEQLEFLTECGCDAYQGFLFSKPLPADDFVDLMISTAGKNLAII